MSDQPAEATANRAPRQARRLSDEMLAAFHSACDQRDLEVAERLLAVLAMVISVDGIQPTAPDRRSKESPRRGLLNGFGTCGILILPESHTLRCSVAISSLRMCRIIPSKCGYT